MLYARRRSLGSSKGAVAMLSGWAIVIQCVARHTSWNLLRRLQLLELMRRGFYQMLEVSGWALWERGQMEAVPS